MAKRDSPTSRASKRRKPAPVKKPFPVGFAVGATVLAVALIGVLVYAANNQGVADKSSLKYAQSKVSGLTNIKGLERNHKAGVLAYADQGAEAPIGGNHNQTPQSCQAYTAPISNVHAVHSLEHGAVWATYNPKTATKDDIAALTKLVTGSSSRMLSPYPGLDSTISLQAWGERLKVGSAKDSRVQEFFNLFTDGPQTQEVGATCVGVTATVTNPTDLAPEDTPTAPATVPSASVTVPSAAPTKK
jgi:hypothetical protein